MFYDSISQVEIELTTRCNAACPQCVRNYYGGRTWPTLPLVDLDLKTIQKSLEPLLSRIDLVKLCGTYGDPGLYKDLIPLVGWLKDHSQVDIVINTNGSLRTVSWWRELAKVMGQRGKVYFGIDGLQDTHHLHRRRTNFDKIIKNLTAFNQAGGRSIWSFIIFRHNQHQVEQARIMAENLGCEMFAVKSTTRFVDKQHRLVDRTPVMSDRDEIEYWLDPTDDPEYVNPGFADVARIDQRPGGYAHYLTTNPIKCHAMHTKLVVISAQGYVLPCGYLHDRFYGYESEQHPDHIKLQQMIEDSGGLDQLSIYHHPIEDIIRSDFFSKLQNSWINPVSRLQRCAHQCGADNTLLVNANRDLAQSWTGRKIIDIQPTG